LAARMLCVGRGCGTRDMLLMRGVIAVYAVSRRVKSIEGTF
jgi:hypothetical protein